MWYISNKKSQICHQLCVTLQIPRELGGFGKMAICVDIEGTISPARVTHVVCRFEWETGWKTSYN